MKTELECNICKARIPNSKNWRRDVKDHFGLNHYRIKKGIAAYKVKEDLFKIIKVKQSEQLMTEVNKIICGDALTVLKTFPDNVIDCFVSSPPYYGLRDYGVAGQLGLEKTFHEYLNKLIEIFAEVKRVLKPTGTIWVNMGDSYSGSSNGAGDTTSTNRCKPESYKQMYQGQKPGKQITDKSLLNIPSRFAIKMTDELNLIQRNEIIWHKPNCMPSSASDRFTVDFEKVYFFTKSKKYYFEQIFEKYTAPLDRWGGTMIRGDFNTKTKDFAVQERAGRNMRPNEQGRNKRCVWDITTKPYKEAHFATFPEDLVRPMIQAGCPEFICNKCGKVREKIYEEKTGMKYTEEGNPEGMHRSKMKWNDSHPTKNPRFWSNTNVIALTDCNCNAGFTGGIVLDPFFGSGTTGVVALKQNKNFIGVELNPEYIKLAEKRINPYLMQTKLAI